MEQTSFLYNFPKNIYRSWQIKNGICRHNKMKVKNNDIRKKTCFWNGHSSLTCIAKWGREPLQLIHNSTHRTMYLTKPYKELPTKWSCHTWLGSALTLVPNYNTKDRPRLCHLNFSEYLEELQKIQLEIVSSKCNWCTKCYSLKLATEAIKALVFFFLLF